MILSIIVTVTGPILLMELASIYKSGVVMFFTTAVYIIGLIYLHYSNYHFYIHTDDLIAKLKKEDKLSFEDYLNTILIDYDKNIIKAVKTEMREIGIL
jgi:hypothetical protein